MVAAMETCYQFEDQSVLDHGYSVFQYYSDLYKHLILGYNLKYEWKLPEWIYDPFFITSLLSLDIVTVYLVYHDCGKPYCRTFDDQGRQHFPDHAKISQLVFDVVRKSHKFSDYDEIVSTLISEDMDIHLLKADGVEEFSKRSFAPTLLLAGLAEIHSNAQMFGGMESIGFKSKYKNLNKRGKALLKIWLNK